MEKMEFSQLGQIVSEFEQVLFPSYLPGIPCQQLIFKYNRLKDDLERIDAASEGHQIPHQFKEPLLNELIHLLNEACSFTHRVQISNLILVLVGRLKYNLAHLPVGRLPIRISQWMEEIPTCKLTQYKEQIKQKQLPLFQRKITIYFDKVYQDQRRISNIDHLLVKHPKLLVAKIEFEEKFLNNPDYVIPPVQKLYIGIIAASTYGCRYLWTLLVKKYINAGGNINWIIQGISSSEVPQAIRKLAELSQILAYNFQAIQSEDFFANSVNGKDIDHIFILQGLYIIAYFQSLSCFCLVNGLIPQSNQLSDCYLSKNITKPSPESFDAMAFKEHKQQIFEQEKAIDFVDTFSVMEYESDQQESTKIKVRKNKNGFWQGSDSEEDVEPNQRKRISSQEHIDFELQEYFKENSLSALEQEEIQNEKLKNLKTLQNIKTIYNKYTTTKETKSNINYPSKTQYASALFKKNHQSSQIHQPSIIYSSDWRFQSDALQAIQETLNKDFATDLKHFIEAFRSNSQKSRNVQIYYEVLHNYLYECIDYPKLMSEQLTSVDKNLVKLITKSPFLFNRQSFRKTRQQLKMNIHEMQQRIMDIVSYKLQLDVSMIALMYKRFITNQM